MSRTQWNGAWLSTVGVPLEKVAYLQLNLSPQKNVVAAPTSVGVSFVFLYQLTNYAVLFGPCQFIFIVLFIGPVVRKKNNSEQKAMHATYPALIGPVLA